MVKTLNQIIEEHDLDTFDVIKYAKSLGLNKNKIGINEEKKILSNYGIDTKNVTTGTLAAPSKLTNEEIIALGRDFEIPVNKRKWNHLRKIYLTSEEENKKKIPSGDTIINRFGSFDNFWEICGFSQNGSKHSIPHELIPEIEKRVVNEEKPIRIAKELGIGSMKLKKFLKSHKMLSPEYVKEELYDLESIMKKEIKGERLFDGEEKELVREIELIDLVKNLQNPCDLRYIGLTNVNFISYIRLSQEYGINSKKSLVAERVKNRARIMKNITLYADKIEGGEIFKGLNIYSGKIEEAIKKYKKLKFNCFDMDYEGGITFEKLEFFKNIFKFDQVEDDSVIYIGLYDNVLEKHRVQFGRNKFDIGFGSENQQLLMNEYLGKITEEHGFLIDNVFCERYKDSTDMIALGYHVMRA